MSSQNAMSRLERRAAYSLAGIFSLRMLGLFMIYPVFTVYAHGLTGATPTTIGLALGAYGLTQALFQIPFGMLSDRFGRKSMITLGLVIFAAGSVVAALSTSIEGVIIGRVLQGAGAVGSAILALGADLTREEQRTKAMAVIGMSIGLSFALAVVVGPILGAWIGVPGIFWTTAVLALLGISLVRFVVPQPTHSVLHRDTDAVPALFKRVLTDAELVRLDAGIFSLHAMLTASFLALPVVFSEIGGFDTRHQWQIYLPALVIGVLLMVPAIAIGEKRRRMKPIFLGAIAILGLVQLAFMEWHHSLWAMAVGLTVFFGAFTLMEASLPSLISKAAPAGSKGTAMGVYSSSQFLGIFVGGTAGGWVYGQFGLNGVFLFAALIAAAWLVIAFGMTNPGYFASRLLDLGRMSETDAARLATALRQVAGVADVVVIAEDGVAYLKVDRHHLDEDALRAITRLG